MQGWDWKEGQDLIERGLSQPIVCVLDCRERKDLEKEGY